MARTTDQQKRVCVLTGAGGRLGSLFCRLCAPQYDIVAIYRRSIPDAATQHQWFVDPLDESAKIADNSNPVFAVQADLGIDTELERVAELALARYGRVDLLINAAAQSLWAPMLRSSALLEGAEMDFRINTLVPLKLALIFCRACWQVGDKNNRRLNRHVINVSSTAGLEAYPGQYQSVYSASKAALNMLTRHMADEFSSVSVRVNAVAPNSFPGIVATERVIDAITYLEQGEMTGKIAVVDSSGLFLV